ncbi:MAG: hypothetical protein QE263_06195 [Vampirovibrionales bacterium]|nr:hypothetical protein [Vampirovibrionales bacterium]
MKLGFTPPLTFATRLKFSAETEAQRLQKEEEQQLQELETKPLNQKQTDAIIAAEKEEKDKK